MLKFDSSRNTLSPKSKLIIFIHGLMGSQETWITQEGSIPTIASQLIKTTEINTIYDFAFFEYESNVKAPSKAGNLLRSTFNQFLRKHEAVAFNLPVDTIAKALETQVNVHCLDYEEFVLIGHSMGGLVSKAYICSQLSQQKSHKVSHFISLAVPHNGSELATFAKYIVKTHPQLKDLSPLNPFLEQLTSTWIKPEHSDLLPKTQYYLGIYDEVVPSTSSLPYDTRKDIEVLSVEHDHSSILKPITDTTVTVGIRNFLSNPSKKKSPY